MRELNIGVDFSGVGAFEQALKNQGIKHNTIFACDKDKYARNTYLLNHQEPNDFPEDVYQRSIPIDPLDIYMTSPPCQSFSLSGKRLGKLDKRGVLFFNSHGFISGNMPRCFIFENVKGLLSDNKKNASDLYGQTFSEWITLLGGKSVNGQPVIFPHPDSVPYHIYWKVLNSKDYGVPQNRERVFIVGFRDDADNVFSWPKEMKLDKRLIDLLDEKVDKKYFLSEKQIKDLLQIDDEKLKVNSANKIGFEIAESGDSINFSRTNSKTRRGGVGKGVSNTLDTSCEQAVVISVIKEVRSDESKEERKKTGTNKFRGKKREIREQDFMNTLQTSPTTDNLIVISPTGQNSQGKRVYDINGISCTINAEGGGLGGRSGLYKIGLLIRRLTPKECFRLMGFPNEFKWTVSDNQAYKQAGNSIVVNVLENILNKINFIKR